MKIVILNYFDGIIYCGDINKKESEGYERWLINKGFNLDEIEWMVADDLQIKFFQNNHILKS